MNVRAQIAKFRDKPAPANAALEALQRELRQIEHPLHAAAALLAEPQAAARAVDSCLGSSRARALVGRIGADALLEQGVRTLLQALPLHVRAMAREFVDAEIDRSAARAWVKEFAAGADADQQENPPPPA